MEIFTAAIELPPHEREAYLAGACATNADLRRRVDVLLAAHDAAGSFLEKPRVVRPATQPADAAGDRIDHYTLLRKIGEGGGGVVWLAEQHEPVRRQVALKILKLGLDTREIIARFEAERQALALMDHPGIARVFDAGATVTGRPYFVMEFVDGLPITRFCDEHQLPMSARLELFTRVCQAVQHAHQKGVIHRDLKPSNILVTAGDGAPMPKVIDFGIAKATEQRLADGTVVTAVEQFLGTPAYMSPEQAQLGGVDIDTRSDVYSLGVLLYELLTGRTPFEPDALLRAGFDEMRRHIREVEPPRPSTRLHTLESAKLATTAGLRHVAPPRLITAIQGDLDWIVMRCLEKERARRYDSPNALAQDLQRHLNHEAVEARPASAAYRFRKLVRRHRLAFGAAAAVAVALLAGVVASTWQAVRASRAERVAANEAAVARAVNDFLLTDLLRAADSQGQIAANEKPNPDLKVREALDRAAAKVGGRFQHEPLVEAAVREAIGESYQGIGLYDAALAQLRRALEIRRGLLGDLNADTLKSAHNVAIALGGQGKFKESVAALRETWERTRRVLGPDNLETLDTLGDLATHENSAGRYADGETHLTAVLAAKRRLFGPDDPATIRAMSALGLTYYYQGKLAAAEKLDRETLALARRVLGPEHPDTLNTLNNLALVVEDEGRPSESLAMKREVVEIRKRTFGPEHPLTLNAMNNVATALSEQGKLAESIALHEQVLAVQRRTLGPDNPDTVTSINNLANDRSNNHEYATAVTLFQEALATLRRTLGPDHPYTLSTMNNLAVAYARQQKNAEAVAMHEQLQDGLVRVFGPDHPNTLGGLNNLGVAYANLGRVKEAVAVHERALAALMRTVGPDHPTTPVVMAHLADEYMTVGRTEDSARVRTQLLDLQRKKLGPTAGPTITTAANLGTALLALQRYGEAEAVLRDVLAVREKTAPEVWTTFNSRAALGAALAGEKKYAEAEPLLVSGCNGMQQREDKIPPVGKPRLTEALQRLVQFYRETNQPGEAAKWQAKLTAHAPAAASAGKP